MLCAQEAMLDLLNKAWITGSEHIQQTNTIHVQQIFCPGADQLHMTCTIVPAHLTWKTWNVWKAQKLLSFNFKSTGRIIFSQVNKAESVVSVKQSVLQEKDRRTSNQNPVILKFGCSDIMIMSTLLNRFDTF